MHTTKTIVVLLLLILLAAPAAWADEVGNDLDGSVDATAEVMSLVVGGSPGTATLFVLPTEGDGRDGCNLAAGNRLVLTILSSDTNVATISPESVTVQSCDDRPVLTVAAVATGQTDIVISQASNDSGATFNVGAALFRVVVTSSTNSPPNVAVTGVSQGSSYEIGTVPPAGCQVSDLEDGSVSLPAVLGAINGPWAAYGIGLQTATCTYSDQGGLTVTVAATYTIVDTTAPLLACNATPTFRLNQQGALVGATVTDAGSGPESSMVNVLVSTATAGSRTAAITAYDNAGNSATSQCPYVVTNPAAFVFPTRQPPAWNEVKAGSAQPVRFALGGSDATVLASGYPRSQRVDCTTLNPIGAAVTISATAAGGLAYNGSHFHVIWKTDKTWSGTCRQFILLLDDGTTIHANFRFK